MEFNVTLKADDGRMVRMAAHQANAIQTMANTRKAGIASVTGYQPSTNWITPPTQNIQLITHISTENLYKRRLEALQAIEFKDILPLCMDDEILSGAKPDTDKAKTMLGVKSLQVLFNARKEQEIASLEKSLASFAGETIETDAHREGHTRCYVHFGSVKVNLETEDGMIDGKKKKVPVLDADGNVMLASIMVPYIELNTTTIIEGERKVVNSGSSVRMKNIIQRALNKRSTALKTLSLKADNFESFKIDGNELLAEDVARFGDIIAA